MEASHRIESEYLQKALAFKHEVHPKDVKIKNFDVTGGSNTVSYTHLTLPTTPYV